MIIEISVALIAGCFAVLVLYTVRLLRTARCSLTQADRALMEIRQHLNEVGGETLQLVRSGHRLAEDLEGKMKSMNALFASVDQLGEAANEVAGSVKQVSAAVVQSAKGVQQAASNQNKIAEIMEWATMGVHLLQKWQAYRSAKASGQEGNQIIKGAGNDGGESHER